MVSIHREPPHAVLPYPSMPRPASPWQLLLEVLGLTQITIPINLKGSLTLSYMYGAVGIFSLILLL